MLGLLARFTLVLGALGTLPACSDMISRQEEVKLNDGRVIIVTQKRRCDGAYNGDSYSKCIAREAWVTFKLPEFGKEEITWNARLWPRVVNVHQGQLNIVGVPHTKREFDFYGRPQPHYLGYKLERGQWQRIAFKEIPEAIYDTNLLIDPPPSSMKLVTLAAKASLEMNGNPSYPSYIKRIDPTYKRYQSR